MKIKRFSSAFLGMNSSLLIKNDSALLVDPGVFPDEIDRIMSYMNDNFIHPIGILITHTHGDHIGGWYAFDSFPTYISEGVKQKTAEQIESDVRYAKGLYKKRKFNGEEIRFPEFESVLESGKDYYIENFHLISFNTPGHASDLTTYIFPEEGLMVTGDMLVAIPVPYILDSFVAYYQSLQLMESLTFEYKLNTLVPGHAHFAHSQEEILERIHSEINYIKSLVPKILPILKEKKSDEALYNRMVQETAEWAKTDAHHYNLKTALKTRKEILDFWDKM